MSQWTGVAEVREYAEDDRNFVLSSWLRSAAKSVPRELLTQFYRSQHEVSSLLLERARCVVLAAADDPAQIVGWACGEMVAGRAVLYWAYVKGPFRGTGAARMLVTSLFAPQKVARPILAAQVQWPTIGKRLVAAGWDIQPALGALMVMEGS